MARLESAGFGQILSKSLWVIGAGWAGLSAAVSAVQAGFAVTLIEANQTLGGRARRVQIGGHTLDNGQHILVGAYAKTLDLMRTVGADPERLLHREPLSLLDAQGEGFRLRAPSAASESVATSPLWRLPSAVDFLISTFATRPWSISQKLSLLVKCSHWALAGFRCPDHLSVRDICSGLSPGVIEDLVSPLCLSAMNTPLALSSGAVFLRILRQAVFSAPGGADFLIPRVDLSTLMPIYCERWLLSHGCTILKGTRIVRLPELTNEHVDPGHIDSPTEERADEHTQSLLGTAPHALIIACDPTNAARLVGELHPSWSQKTSALKYTQIATTYVRCHSPQFKGLGRAVIRLKSDVDPLNRNTSEFGDKEYCEEHPLSNAVVLAPAQFVFDRSRLTVDPSLENPISAPTSDCATSGTGMLSFVSSYATLDNDSITKGVLRQAKEELGLTNLEAVGTITERRATFCCSPTVLRPSSQITRRIWACGDYVEGPYPATLEGAVLSGFSAVQGLVHSI